MESVLPPTAAGPSQAQPVRRVLVALLVTALAAVDAAVWQHLAGGGPWPAWPSAWDLTFFALMYSQASLMTVWAVGAQRGIAWRWALVAPGLAFWATGGLLYNSTTDRAWELWFVMLALQAAFEAAPLGAMRLSGFALRVPGGEKPAGRRHQYTIDSLLGMLTAAAVWLGLLQMCLPRLSWESGEMLTRSFAPLLALQALTTVAALWLMLGRGWLVLRLLALAAAVQPFSWLPMQLPVPAYPAVFLPLLLGPLAVLRIAGYRWERAG